MKRYLSLLLCLFLLCQFGVYTAVCAVETQPIQESAGSECQHLVNGETKTYRTLEEALSAATAGTIQLLADASVSAMVLKPGVTLDLNGYTVTAELCVAMSGASVIDGGEECTGGGLLKVARGNLTLISNNDNVLPVWNGTNGYVFTKVTFQQMEKADEQGVVQYIFLPVMSNEEAAALLANGGEDNDLKIKASLTWNNGHSIQFYTYKDDLVKQVFDGTNQWAFCAEISGISGIQDMTAQAVVLTDTGAQATASGTALVAGS